MKSRFLLIALILACGAAAWLNAQAPLRPSREGVIRAFWECSHPAGTFLIPLDRISNISTHQYVVAGPGAGRVWEVVIADESDSIARFYFMESATKADNPVTGENTAKFTEAALEDVAGATKTEKAWEKVVKAYPDATHAHTVEYRVQSRDSLSRLFEHLRECWMTGRPGRLVVDREED